MKIKTLLVILVALAAVSAGCKLHRGMAGSGNRKSERRDLKSFNAIETSGAFRINITCQQPTSFEIEADDNILPLIKTEVRDGILVVSSDQEFHMSKSAVLRISLPDLARLANHGAGDVIIVDANSNQLELDSTGAASINAAGKAKSIAITSAGAGSIDAANLRAEKASVILSGAGSIEVYATEQVDVNISGVGSVTYDGKPKVVNKHISGFGSVNPK
jgi:hypothetical protein